MAWQLKLPRNAHSLIPPVPKQLYMMLSDLAALNWHMLEHMPNRVHCLGSGWLFFYGERVAVRVMKSKAPTAEAKARVERPKAEELICSQSPMESFAAARTEANNQQVELGYPCRSHEESREP